MHYSPQEALVLLHFEQDTKPVLYHIDWLKLFQLHPWFGLLSVILILLWGLMLILDFFQLDLHLTGHAGENLFIFTISAILIWLVGAYSLVGQKGSNLAYQKRLQAYTGESHPELLVFYAHVYQAFFERSSKEAVQKYVSPSPAQQRF